MRLLLQVKTILCKLKRRNKRRRMGKGQPNPPQLVQQAFDEASAGKAFVDKDGLARFLEKWQGQESLGPMPTTTDMMDLDDFFRYLLDPSLNSALTVSKDPSHDMTAPLTHYYICTSHNTYLRGNQLTSKSSTSPIVSALRTGCRVIELDCWEKRGKVMVLHGGTLTKAVPFADCVKAIRDNAFVASDFPVIITIENHLRPELQQEAAKILREVLGDILYVPPDRTPPKQFLSPMELRRKVIICDKPPEQHIAKQVADDPRGAMDAMPGKSSDSSDSYSSGEEDVNNQEYENGSPNFKKKMDRRIQRRVKRAADKIAEHDFLHDHQPKPKIPELQQLLYIYCEKPSEMSNAPVKGGPLCSGENAIMANLSEPQLKKSISDHPTSLIEYTKTNLGRMYPFGLRFDSSNADPMLAWSHGFQLAALNFQGRDRSCWIASGLFRANGGCGYVRKPDCFLRGENPNEINARQMLKVRVLLGTAWHKRFDLFSKPDFYVKVAIHGIAADKQKKRTKVAHKSHEPNWEAEVFEFPLRVPELAVLRLEVWEHDRLEKDDFAGQACLPVSELRTGIRVVPLYSKKGVAKGSKLLCHFALEGL